jgi:hypothetical protein
MLGRWPIILMLLVRILSYPKLAAASVAQVMAIALTVFRVWFRLYIRRFWWEDAFAASAGLFFVAKMIASWILLNSGVYLLTC